MRTIRSKRSLLAIAAAAAACSLAHGATRTWDVNVASGSWSDSVNWLGNTVPASGDDVQLAEADGIDRTTNYINPGGAGVSLNSLEINSTDTGLFTLSQGQDTLNVQTMSLGVGSNSVGAYSQSGGDLLTNQSVIGAAGAGTFIQSGGNHNATGFISLGDSPTGLGQYNLGGGTLSTFRFDVGFQGTGTVTQSNGLLNVGSFISLGENVAARGTFNMVGGGTISVPIEIVGQAGSGAFVQTAGLNSATSFLSVGELPGSIGTYTIGGVGKISSPEFDVGFQGSGAMVQNGGTVTTDSFNLGVRDGSIGTFAITAGTINAGDVIVGIESNTKATFAQFGGSVTTTGDISIAYSAGSIGEYRFTGGTLAANSVEIAGSPTVANGVGGGTFAQNGGQFSASGAVTVWNRGVYRLTGGTFFANSLNVVGSKFIVAPGSGVIPRVKSLAITQGGQLDVADSKLVIDYDSPSPSPLGNVNTPGTIANSIKTARYSGSGGAWSGAGLTSSVGDASFFGVGYGEASDVLGLSGTATATFGAGGPTVDATTVLVRLTYYGDADLNGKVNFDDYARIDAGFNTGGTGWTHGDFDYNNVVNFDDYALIDLAFNTQSSTLARAIALLTGGHASSAAVSDPALQEVQKHFNEFGGAYASAFLAAVPEPASFTIIGAGAALALRRRRRASR